jgi:UDP-N-acetylglucosamine 3-dehydrogenase
MSNTKTRIAIIGCGGIARAHAKAYLANSDLGEIVACADVAAGAADAFGAEFGCAAYQDARTMLEAARPAAVSVCTPPLGHLPAVRLAAERGIAVLCEKPLTRNDAEAREMVALVEQSGIVFMNALCHRFHGPVNQARELLASGKLGKLIHFYNRFAFRFAGVESRWFVDPEVAGGGILLDTTVHSVDLYRYIAGEVASISAQVSTQLPIKVEDSAAILLRSVDGVLGEISCSWVTPPGEAVVRLYGTEGLAEIDYSAEPNLRYRVGAADWVAVPYQGPDRFAGETRHFLECVQAGKQPRVGVRDGARVIELLDMAYRSAGIAR